MGQVEGKVIIVTGGASGIGAFLELARSPEQKEKLGIGARVDAPADVDFSATAVQTMPQRGTMTGKLYVSKSKMRQEAVQEGQTRITITDGEKNTSWILNPDRKEYVELKGPGAGPAAAGVALSGFSRPSASKFSGSMR